MAGENNEIKTKITPSEDFFNIKKTIFQSSGISTDKISAPKRCGNGNYSDTNTRSKPDEPNSDNYRFLGSYCQYCDFRPKMRSPLVLEIHMRTHTGDKPFSCAVCDFSTADKYYLETHMRKHTGEKPFMCPTCEYSTTRKALLKQHLLTHTNEKPFVCTECNFRCARQKGLQQHWSLYCKFEHFKCSVCDYSCRKLIDLKNHVLTHPAVISCPKCDYMGRCIEDLEKHNIIHIKTKRRQMNYFCSKCGKHFHYKQLLSQHILKNECE